MPIMRLLSAMPLFEPNNTKTEKTSSNAGASSLRHK
eukprot:CAMPEP_0113512122 /NCGR_PEP_ID=MMETSP0014_2-20120614/39163_1 /TAXON_ID=2857 /ORGANISM="Nitzschia sp." /LENGTH=35 /DNA_ID=CAMNT_0000408443 /DNA_START=408 /DNA_END=512 /DNA_ORIENTATION=+ /assembly_acc=CAM_ASM_000159